MPTGLGPVEPAALLSPLHAELPHRQQEIAVPLATVQQSPPMATPMPNRRKFLWIAGISIAGLAAAGGVVAVALTRDPSSPPTDAPVPNGPAPTWTHALDDHFNNGDRSGGLGVMGDVLVRWDRTMAQAFDAATGAPRWTLPDGQPRFSWIGLHGSSLIGTAQDAETDSNLLVAIGSDGKQQFSHNLGRVDGHGSAFSQVLDVAGSIAVLTTSGGPGDIVAIDVSSGKQLWTRALTAYNRALAVTDDQRCYLQDNTDTVCLDLTTGKQLWATPNTCPVNAPTSIALVAGALAIAGERLVVLDAATGVPRRTALQASTGIRRVGVSADLLVVGEHSETASGDDNHTVWGIDPRDGTKVWATHVPLPMVTGVTTSANLVIVPTSTPVSMKPAGILVLDGKTGAIAWTESGGGTADSESGRGTADWLACATPDAVYAASSTTVYAYPRHP
ncbi:PQQ-binding-like beta-propeller repeat protein [Solihabitans fulvus]|uniref:PQQ-binding-like beta-propeller repeat protein n=1 Tax=Solihabitans fulvus TaxID=1892852 RepID=A0A5B2XQS3_9PSEU|nr:PQQ-binding-like beta-propeller repeat protein [Solihabitans fulvus]KAA2265232.1 PQQ-binding-like beta-propeller repeat protein [Solihabitans fulvus]